MATCPHLSCRRASSLGIWKCSNPIPRADVVTWMLWLCSQVSLLFSSPTFLGVPLPVVSNTSHDFGLTFSVRLICAPITASTRQFGAAELSALAIPATALWSRHREARLYIAVSLTESPSPGLPPGSFSIERHLSVSQPLRPALSRRTLLYHTTEFLYHRSCSASFLQR